LPAPANAWLGSAQGLDERGSEDAVSGSPPGQWSDDGRSVDRFDRSQPAQWNYATAPWPIEDVPAYLPNMFTARRRNLYQLADMFEVWAQQSMAMAGGSTAWPSHAMRAAGSGGTGDVVGDQTWTTVRVTGLPPGFTRELLCRVSDDVGFQGWYDFAHVPFDARTGANVGIAEINFDDHSCARAFIQSIGGVIGGASRAEWSAPPLQGLEALTAIYAGFAEDVQDEHAPAWFDGNGRRVPPPQGGGFDVPAPAPPPPPPRTTLEAHDWGEAAESTLVAMLGTPPVPKAAMGGAPVSF